MTPESFWARVDKSANCWLWTGSINNAGYGRIARSGDGVGGLAHRISYELEAGPIPAGLEIDHLCRVRACVNPAHLEPVTRAENVRRAAAAITHCRQGHEYAPENTYIDPRTRKRQCRVCNRLPGRRQRAARRESSVA